MYVKFLNYRDFFWISKWLDKANEKGDLLKLSNEKKSTTYNEKFTYLILKCLSFFLQTYLYALLSL